MRILIAGDWHSELHEEAVFQALLQLGHDVHRFAWHSYFQPNPGRWRLAGNLLKRAQNKYLTGPLIAQINRDLIARAMEIKPDVVFVYRGTHIVAHTLREIRRQVPGAIQVGYNNDDPFSPLYPRWQWRHFIKSIPEYDLVLAYRHRNLSDFAGAGARRVELLRSWYIPARNRPVPMSADDEARYGADVVFAGHYEDDGRLALLEGMMRQGIRLRLYGPPKYWNPVIARSELLAPLGPVRQVWGEEYNKAIAGAKMALCLLSKLNRDTYTRRCFEIPATGTLMLAPYTDDLACLFREDAEVIFFRTEHELMTKIHHYLRNPDDRRRVAAAGHKRVQADGHDIRSRMIQWLGWVQTIQHGQHG